MLSPIFIHPYHKIQFLINVGGPRREEKREKGRKEKGRKRDEKEKLKRKKI